LLASLCLIAAPFAATADNAASGRVLDVIVSLDDGAALGSPGANRDLAAAVAAGHGLEPKYTYGTVFAGFAASVPEHRVAALRNDSLVASVSYDNILTIVAPPWCDDNPDHPACDDDDDNGGGGGDSGQVVPWGVDRVDADLNANTGVGTHVYIVDTGIDSDHPDLQGNLGNGNAFTACKGSPNICKKAWDDDHGHGTHVAGTVGAIDNDIDVVGVAPNVTLHAAKVCDKSGFCSTSAIIGAIDWATEETVNREAASVLNMSLGGSGSKTGECDSKGFTGDDNFHKAVCNAANKGVVIAVAAGNDGADAENSTPAAYDDAVITVSATEEGDDWPSWSNWGDDTADWTDNDSAPVAIAAPGVDILSTWNDGGTNTISGTSMASPHVAGGAALYITTNTQSLNYSAFTNTRGGLLGADESTVGFSNTSGNPHDEDFLDAENL
jgi:subtilisin